MIFSSINKKILVFSDIHQDCDSLIKIMNHENADINICLGDWFDSFYYDDTSDYRKTARLLKQYLSDSRNITLWGNHDLHYLYDSNVVKCSGYEPRKYDAIYNILNIDRVEIRKKFLWYCFLDGYLLTHAGLHPSFIPKEIDVNKSSLDKFLEEESQEANDKIEKDNSHWFYQAGRGRGGFYKNGGIVWLDFDQEYDSIDSIPQIVGHTFRRNRKIQAHHSFGGINPIESDDICIDTNLREYLVFENGKVEIKNILNI